MRELIETSIQHIIFPPTAHSGQIWRKAEERE